MSAKPSTLASVLGVLASTTLALLAGALGGYGYAQRHPAPAGFVIVDMGRLARAIAEDPGLDAAGRERAAQALGQAVRTAAEAYAAAGIAVLDAAAVVRAPEGLFLEPEALLAAEGLGGAEGAREAGRP